MVEHAGDGAGRALEADGGLGDGGVVERGLAAGRDQDARPAVGERVELTRRPSSPATWSAPSTTMPASPAMKCVPAAMVTATPGLIVTVPRSCTSPDQVVSAVTSPPVSVRIDRRPRPGRGAAESRRVGRSRWDPGPQARVKTARDAMRRAGSERMESGQQEQATRQVYCMRFRSVAEAIPGPAADRVRPATPAKTLKSRLPSRSRPARSSSDYPRPPTSPCRSPARPGGTRRRSWWSRWRTRPSSGPCNRRRTCRR